MAAYLDKKYELTERHNLIDQILGIGELVLSTNYLLVFPQLAKLVYLALVFVPRVVNVVE
jgi:hypothetical protein